MKKTLSKSRSKSKYMSKHKKRHMPKHKKSKSKSMSKHRKKQMSKSLTKYNKKYRKKMTKKRTKKGEKKRKKKRGGLSPGAIAGISIAGVAGVAGIGYGLYRLSKGNDNGDKGDDHSQPSSRPIESKPNNYKFIVNNYDINKTLYDDGYKIRDGILYYYDEDDRKSNIEVDSLRYGELQRIIEGIVDNKRINVIKIPYRQGKIKFKDMSKFVDFVGDRSASADDTRGQFMANVPQGTISIDYS